MLKRSGLKRSAPLRRGSSTLKRGGPMRAVGKASGSRRKRANDAGLAETPGAMPEVQHKAALASLGCMACRRLFGIIDGQVELHHRRGGGWGRGGYTTLIPLCVEHHRGDGGVHGLGTKGFARHYGFDQQDLLEDALRLLGLTTPGAAG